MKYILTTLMLVSNIAMAKTIRVYCTYSQDNVDMELVIQDNAVKSVKTWASSAKNPEPSEINADGSKKYEFAAQDWDDTVVWLQFDIKDNRITNKVRLSSGHDSDNYYGGVEATGEYAFKCLYNHLR